MKSWIVMGVLAAALTWSSLPLGATGRAAGETEQQASANVPTGESALGSVRIPRRVLADGKPLAAGTYRVRLTTQAAQPAVAGQLAELERWVEFSQGGQVKGREVVSIVPADEIRQIAEGTPPGSGGTKVEMLKGNEFLRVWINRGGVHYLIHLPPAS